MCFCHTLRLSISHGAQQQANSTAAAVSAYQAVATAVSMYRKSCWRLTQLLILQTDTISQYKHSNAEIAAGDADTYSALVSAISYYGYYDASVALSGARALISQAATADYTRRLGEVGACSAVTTIMSRHAQNASVQHWATRA
eukprot:9680-Heterococcus_DN1.PRE.1